MVRSQVRRGRPGRRLQSLGNPRIDVYRALDVSCEASYSISGNRLLRCTFCSMWQSRLINCLFVICKNKMMVVIVLAV